MCSLRLVLDASLGVHKTVYPQLAHSYTSLAHHADVHALRRCAQVCSAPSLSTRSELSGFQALQSCRCTCNSLPLCSVAAGGRSRPCRESGFASLFSCLRARRALPRVCSAGHAVHRSRQVQGHASQASSSSGGMSRPCFCLRVAGLVSRLSSESAVATSPDREAML